LAYLPRPCRVRSDDDLPAEPYVSRTIAFMVSSRSGVGSDGTGDDVPTGRWRRSRAAACLFRVIGHTYFHVGAMASDLVAAGLSVEDYPGMMLEALHTDR
jgi:hypothetical protein